MKVKIGPYGTYYSANQAASVLLFWLDDGHPAVDRLADWLIGSKDSNSLVARLFTKFQDIFYKRKVKVVIHDYDAFNADETLALIILPLLKKLRAFKCGSPNVDDADVPPELQRPAGAPQFDTDDNWHLRWDWVLNEMIFAFESKHNDWEDQFFSKDTFSYDKDGYEKYQERITNGFRLFGKYYEGLWS